MDMTVEVPELPELTFDEASHIYRLNGDIIPSVSRCSRLRAFCIWRHGR